MNVSPGGKQRIMRDTIWNGKRWRMYTTARDGTKVAKGMKMVLEECGVSTAGRKADWMRETLDKYSDFRDEKCMIEHIVIGKGHVPCFLPKFHPELNPIESVGSVKALYQSTLQIFSPIPTQEHSPCLRHSYLGKHSEPLSQNSPLHVLLLSHPYARTFPLPTTQLPYKTFRTTFAKFATTCFAT